MTETYYTIREVADRFNVHYQTIWGMVKRGEIQATKIRSTYRIPESSLAELAKTGPVNPCD